MEEQYKELLADPAATNKKLKLFYIACGKTDSLFAGAQALHETLDKHEIKHTLRPLRRGPRLAQLAELPGRLRAAAFPLAPGNSFVMRSLSGY